MTTFPLTVEQAVNAVRSAAVLILKLVAVHAELEDAVLDDVAPDRKVVVDCANMSVLLN